MISVRIFLSLVVFRVSQADEHGAEHGEHVGLDECHQEFQGVHENHHDQTGECHGGADANAHLECDEDDARDGEDDGVSCHHVGEETNHQGERLCEDAEEFNDRHHRHGHFQPSWHGRPEDFLPIFLVAKKIDEQERADGKEEGDVDVTGDVCSAREDGDESQKVGDEDEEEGGQEERCIFAVVFLSH